MVSKVMEDTFTACAHMEGSEEAGMCLLLGLDQATMIDKKLSSHDCLERVDQRKFGSALKGLLSQKIL